MERSTAIRVSAFKWIIFRFVKRYGWLTVFSQIIHTVVDIRCLSWKRLEISIWTFSTVNVRFLPKRTLDGEENSGPPGYIQLRLSQILSIHINIFNHFGSEAGWDDHKPSSDRPVLSARNAATPIRKINVDLINATRGRSLPWTKMRNPFASRNVLNKIESETHCGGLTSSNWYPGYNK